jgi:hypothetical protein
MTEPDSPLTPRDLVAAFRQIEVDAIRDHLAALAAALVPVRLPPEEVAANLAEVEALLPQALEMAETLRREWEARKGDERAIIYRASDVDLLDGIADFGREWDESVWDEVPIWEL